MLNRGAAQRLGIADGDLVEIESPTGRTQGQAILREGVRPDVAVVLQQFGHWATPFARDLGMPNLNQVASMDLALTDATGSGADLVPVAIRPAPTSRRADAVADDRVPLPIPLRHPRTELEICEMYMRGL
jgi:anaerobic selenocysteine-containing dehydrogenase